MIGKTISYYRVLEKLGQGGMGEVFLADDLSLGRKVALKFVPQDMQQDSDAHKRFLREARSAAALDHPNICAIHEFGEVDGKDFIVMECVEGQMLRDRLLKGPLALKEALQTAAEIAEALERAHEKGIIHRDFKPTAQQTEVQKLLEDQLRSALSDLDGLLSKDLAGFNDMLRKKNIPNIIAKTPWLCRAERCGSRASSRGAESEVHMNVRSDDKEKTILLGLKYMDKRNQVLHWQ